MNDKRPAKTLANSAPERVHVKRHGPEPERLKVSGYKNWEDAIAPILGKRRPPGVWSK